MQRLFVCLLLAFQRCDAAFDMRVFAMKDVKTDTGFEASTLQHIWDKYNAYGGSAPCTFGGQLRARDRSPSQAAFYFYLVFVYIHKCPVLSWVESFKSADGTYRACTRCMQLHVWPTAAALAALIDEIDYTWRLDPHNHALPPFDRAVTGIVDTLPIYIPSPHNWYLSTLFFQPKYKACVLKMQLGISLMGDIILWTGPHLGVTSDKTIWETTWEEHPFTWWERWLADLGYVGCLGLIYKFKKVKGRPRGGLTREQILFNNIQEHVRNRIEQVPILHTTTQCLRSCLASPLPSRPSPNASPLASPHASPHTSFSQVVSIVKDHRIFKQRIYRGSYRCLQHFLVIVGHVTAYELHRFQRFVSYGPWPH